MLTGTVVLCLAVVGAALYVYFRPGYYTPASVGTVPAASAQTPRIPGAVVGAPTDFSFPAQGVKAPIVPVGLNASGGLTIPTDPRTLGWWQYGAAPGESRGTVVVAGHVDTAATGAGALFHLSTAAPGQTFTLTTTAGTFTYRVVAREVYLKATLPESVFDRTGAPRLVVITCGGPFNWTTHHYADNVVVYAVPLVSAAPHYTTATLGKTTVHLSDAHDASAATSAPGEGILYRWGVPRDRSLAVTGPAEVVFVDEDRVVAVDRLGNCARSCPALKPGVDYTAAVVVASGSVTGVSPGASASFTTAR